MQLLKANHQSSGKDGFEDLQCYKLALDVILNAHQLAGSLPVEEKYDLVQQIRRASKSVAANIAEGYGRYHYLDTLRFYSIARGSLNETLSHLITANLLNYVDEDYYQKFYMLIREAERTLNGLMRYVHNQRRGGDLYQKQTARENLASYEADFLDHEQEMESFE